MKMNDIRQFARERNLKPSRLRKTELIRLIQADEGNPTCFATGQVEDCGQPACLWRNICR